MSRMLGYDVTSPVIRYLRTEMSIVFFCTVRRHKEMNGNFQNGTISRKLSIIYFFNGTVHVRKVKWRVKVMFLNWYWLYKKLILIYLENKNKIVLSWNGLKKSQALFKKILVSFIHLTSLYFYHCQLISCYFCFYRFELTTTILNINLNINFKYKSHFNWLVINNCF